MRVARRLLVAVFLVAGCSSSPIAWLGASPFAGWDTYSFVGKSTLAVRGDLENLVVSPSGKTIAFIGFQPWRKGPGIFVGALDGYLRHVAPHSNGVSTIEMAWSQNEASLTYSVVGTDVASDGMDLYRTNVVDGRTTLFARTRKWIGLDVPRVTDRVMWYRGNAKRDERIPFTILDTATGDQRTILEDANPERAAWSDDGGQIGLVYSEAWKGPLTLALLDVGSDTPVPLETLDADDRLETVYWTADGAFTAIVFLRSTNTLILRRYVPGGAPVDSNLDFVTEALGSPYLEPSPRGTRLHTRYDFRRQDAFIHPDMESHPEPRVQNALVDLQARAVKKFPPRVVPHGWLDEDRVFISTGVGNYKEYSVLDVRHL